MLNQTPVKFLLYGRDVNIKFEWENTVMTDDCRRLNSTQSCKYTNSQ